MARKESLDRALIARVRTQIQTTDVESLLSSASDDLLAFIRKVPLTYGYWGDFKRLAKAAEKSTTPDVIAALLARLDTVDLPRHSPSLPEAPLAGELVGVGRMQFDGTYAYLLSTDWRARGLHIVDMTLPAAPALVSHVKVENLNDIARSGTKLFLLQGDAWNAKGRLSCYDISDPAHPRPEGGIEVSSGYRLAVSGTLIAVLATRSRLPGLLLFDASQPGHIALRGQLPIPDPLAIRIIDNIAYILHAPPRGDGGAGIVLVDLSDPMHPRQIQDIPTPPARDLFVQGRYAYLTCAKGKGSPPDAQTGVGVLDLAPPNFAAARQIALLPLPCVQEIEVQGRYAYVTVGRTRYGARNTAGVRIVDIADPTRPQLVGSFRADDSGSLAVGGDVVCVGIRSRWRDQFRALYVGDPTQPLLFGASPGRETLAYMKRRGRRLLHTLALRDPGTYVRTAFQTLIEAGQTSADLDPRTRWISLDLLYGGGTRYQQMSHGRGTYGAPRPGLSLRTREERFPELWDRYPELAEQLLTTPKLPWQTWEMACKILRGRKTPLPAFNDKMLAQFLTSPSPLLRSVAGRQVVAALTAGRSVAADVAADTFLGGTRRQRASLGRYLVQQPSDARWPIAFATRLYQTAGSAVNGPQLPRKVTLAFALLISRFPTLFLRDLQPNTVAALYNTRRADFTAWTLEVFRNLLPMQLPEWLTAVEAVEGEAREAAVQAILAGMASKEALPRAVEALVWHERPWVREIGWRVLAHSQTSLAPIASAWSDLLNSHEPIPALLTAFGSPDALALFSRCNFDSQLMAARLDAHPFLIPLLPLAALEKIVAVVPPALVMRLVLEASEAQWPGLRTAILLGPLLPENRAAFWREAFSAIGAAGQGTLIQRLLEDPQMQAAFLQLADISEFLRSANPLFGPLLGRWIGAHTDLLLRDSADLLQIATHPLPDIRTVGLNRVRQVGMSLPFALRLLESEVPPSASLGKTFFEQIEAGDPQRTEAITALCDSPKPSVRAYGREILTARPDMLVDPDILARLSENPDPATQAFVARQLLTQSTTADQTGIFDRAVLRARDKGRRAKELVKQRLNDAPTPDVTLLLEMARSRTPRDVDWALGQLAKLALEGVEIPGFTLDGVAGG